MDKFTLTAAKRTILGRKVKKMRLLGIVPANIFGKKVKSEAIELPEKEFSAVFAKAGETGLIDLKVDGSSKPVLVHNLQYHPVDSSIVHVDFYQVDLKEKVTAKVPVVLIGEAPAVKDKVGVILHLINELEVEALPQDLVDKIMVDVTKLAKIDDGIKVGDLKVSDKIKIINDTELELVKIAPLVSKAAEKMAAEEAAAAAAAAATVPAAGAEGVTPPGTPAGETVTPASSAAPKSEEKKN